MKKLFLLIITIISYNLTFANNDTDILKNIQQKVDSISGQVFINNDITSLTDIQKEINLLPKENFYTKYWSAYIDLKLATYYKSQNNPTESEKCINKAIDSLKSVKKQNAETLSLLAYCQSFSIQFYKGMSAGMISQQAASNAQKALKLKPQNIRALFVSGLLDYYTPKMYGGGTKYVEYFTQVTNIKETENHNPYLPHWGEAMTYNLLIKHYLEQNNNHRAKAIYQSFKKKHPHNHQLNKYENKFTN